MYLYLNIETAPPVGTRPDMNAVRAPKHWKDIDKINAYKREHADTEWMKLQTNLALAQVFIVSLATTDGDVEILLDVSEAGLIAQAQARIASLRDESHASRFVSFNGYKFDWPILMARAVKYGCGDLARWMQDCLTNRSHVDPFQLLGREGSLDEWGLSMLGTQMHIDHPNPIRGSEMGMALLQGRHEEVVAHARSRITILRAITKKLQDAGVL